MKRSHNLSCSLQVRILSSSFFHSGVEIDLGQARRNQRTSL
jgi:hypothetical protein